MRNSSRAEVSRGGGEGRRVEREGVRWRVGGAVRRGRGQTIVCVCDWGMAVVLEVGVGRGGEDGRRRSRDGELGASSSSDFSTGMAELCWGKGGSRTYTSMSGNLLSILCSASTSQSPEHLAPFAPSPFAPSGLRSDELA